MEISIESIDMLRNRANISYRQARELLEKTGGDLVEALIYLEENKESIIDNFSERGRDIFVQARGLAGRLHRTKVKVKVKDKTLLEMPVTVTALGAAVFPKLAALSMIGLLFSSGSIEVNGIKGEDQTPQAADEPPEDYQAH